MLQQLHYLLLKSQKPERINSENVKIASVTKCEKFFDESLKRTNIGQDKLVRILN